MEQLNNILTELSKQFNVAVEHLYGVLIKQSMIDGIIYLVYIAGFVVITAACIKYIRWLYVIEDEDGDNGWDRSYSADTEALHITAQIVGGVVWIILACCFVYWVGNAITAFLNPEYYAIQRLLGLMSGG